MEFGIVDTAPGAGEGNESLVFLAGKKAVAIKTHSGSFKLNNKNHFDLSIKCRFCY